MFVERISNFTFGSLTNENDPYNTTSSLKSCTEIHNLPGLAAKLEYRCLKRRGRDEKKSMWQNVNTFGEIGEEYCNVHSPILPFM